MAFNIVGNYPPQIEGKIVAQYGSTLQIPFFVGYTTAIENKTLYIRVKTINNDIIISGQEAININWTDKIATFSIGADIKLNVGQYYKAQLSFDNNIYSNAGIFKYTSAPTVSIEGLFAEQINTHQEKYLGIYANADSEEKVYQYKFILSQNSQIIEESDIVLNTGELISYQFRTILKERLLYGVQYIVYTTGGLIAESPVYLVKKQEDYPLSNPVSLNAKANIENGTIDVYVAPGGDASEQMVSGMYVLYRTSSLSNFTVWENLGNLTINTILLKQNHWQILQDKTVQQGVVYKYAIQQYYENIFTTKIETELIKCDFEDAFLFDGTRQVKLKYNPKIANFKTINLEQKVETLGGKYPFIFRNGYTNYKELSLSALISILMEDEEQVLALREGTNSDKNIIASSPTDLTGDNFALERQYKLELLDWLNNGKPKLFRSPAEGNYVVRLTNISLTPNDTLGRMLHTFNATAYEIADCTHDSLISLGLAQKLTDNLSLMNYQSFNLNDYRAEEKIILHKARIVRIREASPGAIFKLYLNENNDYIPITIGQTGVYEYIADGSVYISAIEINPIYKGIVEVGQFGQVAYPVQDVIEYNEQKWNVVVVDYDYKESFAQFFAQKNNDSGTVDILEKLNIAEADESAGQVISQKLTNICVLQVENRPIIEVSEGSELPENPIKTAIYKINDSYYLGNDTDTGAMVMVDKLNTKMELDGVSIEMGPNINDVKSLRQGRFIYTLDDFNGEFVPTTTLTIGNGLIAHVYYTAIHTKYERA